MKSTAQFTQNAVLDKSDRNPARSVHELVHHSLLSRRTELGRYLAENLSVAMADNAKRFEVIHRTDPRVSLRDHHLASTGILDPVTALKFGQIAGVGALVTGTIAQWGDR